MTDTDIVTRLAREAGLELDGDMWFSDHSNDPMECIDVRHVDLARFAALVAEECAKVCESEADDAMRQGEGGCETGANACARAIRAKFKA